MKVVQKCNDKVTTSVSSLVRGTIFQHGETYYLKLNESNVAGLSTNMLLKVSDFNVADPIKVHPNAMVVLE